MAKTRALVASMFLLALLLAPGAGRADTRQARNDITITYDGEFDRAHGVRRGKGTATDPYVISGWAVNNLSIRDTTKHVEIHDNTVAGTLTLDWVGSHIHVMHNDIGDLRVNQNNARWGDPTSGTFMHNTIGTVGQLRHFDGVFSHNTVGAPTRGLTSSSYPSTRAVNFDGFNNGRFTNNTIYGFVDARIHGHHHGSGFGVPSHLHADGPHARQVDHAKRFHEVTIKANRIYTTSSYALAYLDTNHADNDRTANSETNPWLNAPHQHFTRVRITGNQLFGAGILVDVFNAKDPKHAKFNTGLMEIAANRAAFERDVLRPMRALNGIEVRQARWMSLRVLRNEVAGAEPLVGVDAVRQLQSTGAGVLLHHLDRSNVLIDAQKVSNMQTGVRALQMSSTVHWTIRGLSTNGVNEAVVYDATVKNPPRRS